MAKASHKEKILSSGLRTVYELGFGGAGIRDIVKAAGVPQGSFTNHFASKEVFGLEILNLYHTQSVELIDNTLLNDALPPLDRLALYIDGNRKQILADDLRNGCLYGNFSAEVVDHSEVIRSRLVEIYAYIRESIAHCLQAAVDAEETPPISDISALAGLILSSTQGAILLSKAERSVASFDNFKELLLDRLVPRRT